MKKMRTKRRFHFPPLSTNKKKYICISRYVAWVWLCTVSAKKVAGSEAGSQSQLKKYSLEDTTWYPVYWYPVRFNSIESNILAIHCSRNGCISPTGRSFPSGCIPSQVSAAATVLPSVADTVKSSRSHFSCSSRKTKPGSTIIQHVVAAGIRRNRLLRRTDARQAAADGGSDGGAEDGLPV